MVARLPVGLSTSAFVHAAGVTLLILIPVLGRAPLPEPSTGKTVLIAPPVVPEARRSVPAPMRPRAGGPWRASDIAVPIAHVVPVAAPAEELPIEDTVDAPGGCLICPSDVIGVPDGGEGEGPVGDGSPDVEGTGGGGGPLRVGSGVDMPRKLEHVAPRYPELAQRAGLQGTVELECVIDPAGAVSEIRVLRGPTLLREAAIEAVRRWRYKPTRLNGVPVPIIMTVTVHFSLRRES